MKSVFFLVLLGVLCNVINCVPLTEEPEPEEQIAEQMSVRFYNGQTIDDYVTIPFDDVESVLNSDDFSISQRTIFYLHGYSEKLGDPSVVTVISAYLASDLNVNLLALDWSLLVEDDYLFTAIPNARKVAPLLANKIKLMLDNGMKLELLHIIGHSLGGQLAGLLGKSMQNVYDIKLPRITALDPAGPSFNLVPSSRRLDAGDADVVESILTDPRLYGYPSDVGTASFWPNKEEKLQPGCPDVGPLNPESFCSHRRSWMYWAESVGSPEAFLGYDSETDTYAIMGEYSDGSIHGSFSMITGAESPFGLGSEGVPEEIK